MTKRQKRRPLYPAKSSAVRVCKHRWPKRIAGTSKGITSFWDGEIVANTGIGTCARCGAKKKMT